MALVPVVTLDHLQIARDRVTQQFKDKEIIDKLLQLLIDEQEELEDLFKALLQQRSIDEAVGAQLDIIGEIVGQPRELISVDLFDFFGFQGALKAGSMGDVNNPAVGAIWYNFGDPLGGNVKLDDDTYRLFIKAKILKNTTASTPEEFLNFINFLFGTPVSALISEGNAEFTVLFGRALTDFEKVLLNYSSTSQGYPSRLIPKTLGVDVNFGEFRAENYFGFQGSPAAKSFGDTGSTNIGGIFATIY